MTTPINLINFITSSVGPVVAQIDMDSCNEIPFMSDAANAYYGYLNGASGWVVFFIGTALLTIGMFSKKQLNRLPGGLAAVIVLALALLSFPILLPAFGIDLGCTGGPGIVDGGGGAAPGGGA